MTGHTFYVSIGNGDDFSVVMVYVINYIIIGERSEPENVGNTNKNTS